MPSLEWNKCWANNLKEFEKDKLSRKASEGYSYGDQWGIPTDNNFFSELISNYISPYIKKETIALEIGPGGGRITQFALDAKKLYLVDLNKEMLDYTFKRFDQRKNLELIKTNGTDFPSISNNSIDFVYSYDVFVHLDLDIINEYIKNIYSILKDKGRLSIHFSNKRKPMAWKNPGFSFNYPESMKVVLKRNNFKIEKIDDKLIPHSTLIHAVKI